MARYPRTLLGLAAAAAVFTTAAAPASALLSLTAGAGATISPFAPAQTGTGSGSLTATDTSASWTLQVQDSGSGAGHMVAATTGCSGSDSQLTNPLQVSVSSVLGGVTSAGTQSIGSSPVTVASASNQVLSASLFTTTYTQVIPAAEMMRIGCAYTLTASYTLQ